MTYQPQMRRHKETKRWSRYVTHWCWNYSSKSRNWYKYWVKL